MFYRLKSYFLNLTRLRYRSRVLCKLWKLETRNNTYENLRQEITPWVIIIYINRNIPIKATEHSRILNKVIYFCTKREYYTLLRVNHYVFNHFLDELQSSGHPKCELEVEAANNRDSSRNNENNSKALRDIGNNMYSL